MLNVSPVWLVCLEQAWEAYENGSPPIGAAVVDGDGTIISVGRNRLGETHAHAPHLPGTPYLTATTLAHAEINALLAMGEVRRNPRPTLYATTEPCPMCMGAARMAGIGHVIYASRDFWGGAAGMAESVQYLKRSGPTVEGPVPDLEEPLQAWQLASRGHIAPDDPFATTWSSLAPRAYAAAGVLHADGGLATLARDGNLDEV